MIISAGVPSISKSSPLPLISSQKISMSTSLASSLLPLLGRTIRLDTLSLLLVIAAIVCSNSSSNWTPAIFMWSGCFSTTPRPPRTAPKMRANSRLHSSPPGWRPLSSPPGWLKGSSSNSYCFASPCHPAERLVGLSLFWPSLTACHFSSACELGQTVLQLAAADLMSLLHRLTPGMAKMVLSRRTDSYVGALLTIVMPISSNRSSATRLNVSLLIAGKALTDSVV
mmetsp:Transcript_6758/g.20560  ORF Transcript_6758/g.20560 Transcript_6758/m.20560 type:complete len:226 (+) Transcript_6758:158-835(+)